jgi:hypothetical protein
MSKRNDELDEREALAAHVIRAVYGQAWSVIPRDIQGAPAGTYDLDLVDDSVTVAVEVSTIAEQSTVDDAMRWDRFFPGLKADIPGLSNGWLLMASDSGNPRKLLRGLPRWLADLERLGIGRVWTDRWQAFALEPDTARPPEFATLRELTAVGVRSVEPVKELDPGRCCIITADDGFEWNASEDEFFSDFVSDQLAGPHRSDVKKVERADADRRVVFLWLHALSHFAVIRRLDHGLLQGELTNTGALDEVWVGRSLNSGDVIAYRWLPNTGWAVFEVSGRILQV